MTKERKELEEIIDNKIFELIKFQLTLQTILSGGFIFAIYSNPDFYDFFLIKLSVILFLSSISLAYIRSIVFVVQGFLLFESYQKKIFSIFSSVSKTLFKEPIEEIDEPFFYEKYRKHLKLINIFGGFLTFLNNILFLSAISCIIVFLFNSF